MQNLQTTTAAAVGLARAVVGDGGHVLDAADLHAVTGESAECLLRTRTGGTGLHATSSADLHVDGGDAWGRIELKKM